MIPAGRRSLWEYGLRTYLINTDARLSYLTCKGYNSHAFDNCLAVS